MWSFSSSAYTKENDCQAKLCYLSTVKVIFDRRVIVKKVQILYHPSTQPPHPGTQEKMNSSRMIWWQLSCDWLLTEILCFQTEKGAESNNLRWKLLMFSAEVEWCVKSSPIDIPTELIPIFEFPILDPVPPGFPASNSEGQST